ncbi:hypothetical protein H8356DRAFT_1339463 [Neocallimastix lanati (nom. inval.)]|nr:hypothetical protein H8356DRAFT_1339463 [Neocallimastix sp. JGI-2020a]
MSQEIKFNKNEQSSNFIQAKVDIKSEEIVFVYISYFSTIKTTSYAMKDFSTNIIYTDFNFQEWRLVNDEPNSKDISKLMEEHYNTEEKKTKRSTSDSDSINLREINHGCNVEFFYIKEELLEMLIYSIYYKQISVEKKEKIYKEEKQ